MSSASIAPKLVKDDEHLQDTHDLSFNVLNINIHLKSQDWVVSSSTICPTPSFLCFFVFYFLKGFISLFEW